MIAESDVIAAYRLLLDREPESRAIIDEKCQNIPSVDALIADLVCSREFAARNRDALLAAF